MPLKPFGVATAGLDFSQVRLRCIRPLGNRRTSSKLGPRCQILVEWASATSGIQGLKGSMVQCSRPSSYVLVASSVALMPVHVVPQHVILVYHYILNSILSILYSVRSGLQRVVRSLTLESLYTTTATFLRSPQRVLTPGPSLVLPLLAPSLVDRGSRPIVTMSKTFSTNDVASHKTPESLWIIVDQDVYDVTKFQEDHPGRNLQRPALYLE